MSSGLAALIAHSGFWFLLAYGYFWDEIDARGILVFAILWAAGLYALRYAALGSDLSTSFVAVLDIVLVFIIFKGDVRLT